MQKKGSCKVILNLFWACQVLCNYNKQKSLSAVCFEVINWRYCKAEGDGKVLGSFSHNIKDCIPVFSGSQQSIWVKFAFPRMISNFKKTPKLVNFQSFIWAVSPSQLCNRCQFDKPLQKWDDGTKLLFLNVIRAALWSPTPLSREQWSHQWDVGWERSGQHAAPSCQNYHQIQYIYIYVGSIHIYCQQIQIQDPAQNPFVQHLAEFSSAQVKCIPSNISCFFINPFQQIPSISLKNSTSPQEHCGNWASWHL